MTDYMSELVDRAAPRWAWDIIDRALEADDSGPSNEDLAKALEAMVNACES